MIRILLVSIAVVMVVGIASVVATFLVRHFRKKETVIQHHWDDEPPTAVGG